MSMRIDCEQVRELLSSLVDGELSSAQRKIVSAHMLTCDECSTFGGRILAAKGIVLRDEPEADAPAEFFERMQERLDAVEGVRHQVRRPGPARRMTAIAAMGAIAVSVALILSTVFFIGVEDVAQAFLLASQYRFPQDQHPPFEAFYLSSADTFMSEPTLDALARRFDPLPEIRDPQYFAANPHAVPFDTRKAQRMLGWKPSRFWRDYVDW